MSSAYSVLADCPHCRTESAVLETVDPDHPLAASGLPVERRCRMCGWHEVAAHTGARLVTADLPGDLSTPDRASAALERWSREDGEEDLGVFCRGVFGAEPAEVAAKLVAGEPVPTSLDVIAYLFPGGGTGSVARSVEPADEPAGVRAAPSGEAIAPEPGAEVPAHPRAVQRLLASVMLADGTLGRSEQRVVDAFLRAQGLGPLEPGDLRVWRPVELGSAPALARRAIEIGVAVAHADRLADESEWRVLRAFAAAWGVPEAEIGRWSARYEGGPSGLLARLMRWVRRSLASG